MAVKLTRLAHKIAIQLHLVAESCAICSSRPQAASPETIGYTLVLMLYRKKWVSHPKGSLYHLHITLPCILHPPPQKENGDQETNT
jgi:hypothetical protein